MRTIITLLFVFGLLLVGVAQNVGETAPDFTLKDLNNKDYTLSEKKGEVVFLFLIGYNCPLCLGSASDVKSQIVDEFKNNSQFHAVVIDVWDGNASSVKGFKNQTGIEATYLLDGSNVASNWKISHDRLVVIDGEGKMAFKGTRSAKSDASSAKSAVQNALNALVKTSAHYTQATDQNILMHNYPNPVSDITKIVFRLGKADNVELNVYDLTGKMVAKPVDSFYPSGVHEVLFNRAGLPNGIYLYRLNSGTHSETRRMVLK